MFLSVIIPTYNRLDELIRCLESLFQQARKPDEILIVDGSEDSSAISISEHYKNQVKIINSGRGITRQRNVGVSNLSVLSDIVLFLDDDIVLEPDYTEKILKCYEEDENCIFGGIEGYPLIDGLTQNRRIFNPRIENRKTLYGCNMSFRRKVFDTCKFDENFIKYSLYEDMEFSLQVMKNYKLLRVNDAICYHYASQRSRVSERYHGYMRIANRYYVKRKHHCYSVNDFFISIKFTVKDTIRFFKPNIRERGIGNWIGWFCVLKNIRKPEQLLKKEF